MTPVHPLVPTSKYDVDTARLAVQAGFPAVGPVLYEFLGCLQDLNWPVAHELFDFLASIGAPLGPHIQRVFAGDDYVWQYWLCELLRESPSLYAISRADVHRIASAPTVAERAEELDLRCADLIRHHEPSDVTGTR